jgi:Putative Actinobacterial Holin-X, holin superfamily III
MKGNAMSSAANRSIPELLSDAVGQLAKLVGNEFELARLELSEKVNQATRAVAMIGAGAVILIPALMLLLFAVAAGLMQAGLSESIAYLLTGLGAAVVSATLIAIGINRLSGDALKPSLTLEQVQRDKLAAREIVR